MVRQLVVALLLGLGLTACGAGADEEYGSLGLALVDPAAVTSSQDPVPPREEMPGELYFAFDKAGNLVVITSGSTPANPGGEGSSSQDPVPPKIQNGASQSSNPTDRTTVGQRLGL